MYIVISLPWGMLLVYRPDLGLIYRNTPSGSNISDLYPVAMWLPGYQWRHYATWCQTRTISTSKWRQSVCRLCFASRTLVPRSTLVYRWSRLKEESPGILFEGKVEWASGLTSHLHVPDSEHRQGKPLPGRLSVWQLTRVVGSKIHVKKHHQ